MNNNEKQFETPTEAREINRLHRECCGDMRTTLEKAITIGGLLVEQKEKCKEKKGHGHWIYWVEGNLDFGREQAFRYIKCYDNRSKLPNVASKQHLSIEQFSKLTDKPREEVSPQSKEEKKKMQALKFEKAKEILRGDPILTTKEAAKLAGVGETTVKEARNFLIESGEIAITSKAKAVEVKPEPSKVETPVIESPVTIEQPKKVKQVSTRDDIIKVLKKIWNKHAASSIVGSTMADIIDSFAELFSLGSPEEIQAAWLQYKPTVSRDGGTIRIPNNNRR